MGMQGGKGEEHVAENCSPYAQKVKEKRKRPGSYHPLGRHTSNDLKDLPQGPIF
jgi:hypothetical protein